jgi:hypothetical protein
MDLHTFSACSMKETSFCDIFRWEEETIKGQLQVRDKIVFFAQNRSFTH